MQIIEIRKVTNEVVNAFSTLIPQLSSSNPIPTEEHLTKIIASDSCHLFVAQDSDSDNIIGTLTLVVYPIPTGIRAWIEDVVVDQKARKKGVASQLTQVALEYAANLGAKMVDLTSRPSREAANHLYLQLGFVKRDTNVYRYLLDTVIDSI